MFKDYEMQRAVKLRREGKKIKEIAVEIGRCERTVYNYLDSEYVIKGTRKRGPGKLAPYLPFIDSILKDSPDYNRILLLNRLKKMGYQGQISILRDYCAKKCREITEEAVIRFETEPARQAQVDWKMFGTQMVDGKKQKLYAFVMVMGYSRSPFVHFTTSMNQPTLHQCHVLAFNYFRGVPQEILYDNMKTAYVADSDGIYRVNRALLHFANHYLFTPRRCRIFRPQTKGKVERFINYLGGNFWAGLEQREFRLDELNEQVMDWIEQINELPFRYFNKSRRERFLEEAPHLQALPATGYDCREINELKVSRESFISYKTNRYSLPPCYLGKKVVLKVEPMGRRAAIYLGGELIREFDLVEEGLRQKLYLADDKRLIRELWERQQKRNAKKRKMKPEVPAADVELHSPGLFDRLFSVEVA